MATWLLGVALGVALGLTACGLLLWYLRRQFLRALSDLEGFAADGSESSIRVEHEMHSPEDPGAVARALASLPGGREIWLSLSHLEETIRSGRRVMIEREQSHLNWLSFLCHDLGAPLRRVLTRIEALEFADDTLSAEEREKMLESAHLEITQMSQLIASVNDYARFEYHTDRSFEPMPLDNLLTYAVQVFEFDASRKCIELDLRIVPGIGNVNINEYLLRRAVENLISNAIRFTPQGGLIGIRAERIANLVRIKVSDTGPGVLMDEISKIFDVGFRGRMQAAVSGGLESVGLGLALVRGVAQLHGGDVTVKNRDEGGAEFVITLPAASEQAT